MHYMEGFYLHCSGLAGEIGVHMGESVRVPVLKLRTIQIWI
jgi:hypothetical protein